jgi:hypothetical protein
MPRADALKAILAAEPWIGRSPATSQDWLQNRRIKAGFSFAQQNANVV